MVKRVTAYRNEKRIRIASNWKMCRMAHRSLVSYHTDEKRQRYVYESLSGTIFLSFFVLLLSN